MSIKSIIRRWLGIEEPKSRVSAARAYAAPVQYTYKETTQRLPFEAKRIKSKFKRTMPIRKNAPKTAEELYKSCGGYEIFREILRHPNWYNIRCDQRNDGYTHTLRVLNRNNRTDKGFYESKTMRVRSKHEGEAVAKRLLDIHALNISKRTN